MSSSLEDLMAAAPPPDADVRKRLQWIEDVAGATEAADLGEVGATAALQLRAALGTMVKWSQGPQTPESTVELEALVRLLLARGTLGIYQALAASYDEMARTGPRATAVAAGEAREVFLKLAQSVESGKPPPPSLQQRLERIRAALPEDIRP